MELIEIVNNGPEIVSTNYWDHEYCQKGYFYLTWNAGAGRLLIPEVQFPLISEMKTGNDVIISRGSLNGKDSYEILFEDYTEQPFSIHIGTDQSDRTLPSADTKKSFIFSVWTKDGFVKSFLAKYRMVKDLPCLEPWR